MKNTAKLRVIIAALLLLPAGAAMANHEFWVHDAPIDENGELIPGIPSEVGTLNVFTGEYTPVGIAPTVIYDLAFSPDGTLYGIEPYNWYSMRLWEIDTSDPAGGSVMRGLITTQLNPYVFSNSLVFGPDGTMYTAGWYWAGRPLGWRNGLIAVQVTPGGADNPGQVVIDMGDDPAYSSQGDLAFAGDDLYLTVGGGDLVELYPEQGTFEVIGPLGFELAWAMGYDDDAGVMYAASGATDQLFAIDLTTGHGTLLFDFGDQISFIGGLSTSTEAGAPPDHMATRIDIKPGSNPSAFRPGNAHAVPVAIFGSPALDVTEIDPLSIELYGMAVRRVGKGKLQVAYEDVDSDGTLDMVVKLDAATFAPGDGILRAALPSGMPVYGFQPAGDPVKILGR
jgi:hypothetical protein